MCRSEREILDPARRNRSTHWGPLLELGVSSRRRWRWIQIQLRDWGRRLQRSHIGGISSGVRGTFRRERWLSERATLAQGRTGRNVNALCTDAVWCGPLRRGKNRNTTGHVSSLKFHAGRVCPVAKDRCLQRPFLVLILAETLESSTILEVADYTWIELIREEPTHIK